MNLLKWTVIFAVIAIVAMFAALAVSLAEAQPLGQPLRGEERQAVLESASKRRTEDPASWRCKVSRQSDDGYSVNDSHGVLGGGCQQYPNVGMNAWVGRTTAEGVNDLDDDLRARHEFVVYDLGTNDVSVPGTTRAALREVHDRIGNRELFLVTVKRLDQPYGWINDAITDFGASHQGVRVIPWAGAAQPSDFSPDQVHLTGAGYAKRTAFICDKVALRGWFC